MKRKLSDNDSDSDHEDDDQREDKEYKDEEYVPPSKARESRRWRLQEVDKDGKVLSEVTDEPGNHRKDKSSNDGGDVVKSIRESLEKLSDDMPWSRIMQKGPAVNLNIFWDPNDAKSLQLQV